MFGVVGGGDSQKPVILTSVGFNTSVCHRRLQTCMHIPIHRHTIKIKINLNPALTSLHDRLQLWTEINSSAGCFSHGLSHGSREQTTRLCHLETNITLNHKRTAGVITTQDSSDSPALQHWNKNRHTDQWARTENKPILLQTPSLTGWPHTLVRNQRGLEWTAKHVWGMRPDPISYPAQNNFSRTV